MANDEGIFHRTLHPAVKNKIIAKSFFANRQQKMPFSFTEDPTFRGQFRSETFFSVVE